MYIYICVYTDTYTYSHLLVFVVTVRCVRSMKLVIGLTGLNETCCHSLHTVMYSIKSI